MTSGQNGGPNRGQNERLRELLAEARQLVGFLPTYPAGFDLVSEMRQRIDAALAEPGDVHPSNLTDVVTLLENDRDEARAEVEHWKAAAKQHAENHTAAVEAYFLAERERDEARAEVERLRKALDERWDECHDGSEHSCSKSHED